MGTPEEIAEPMRSRWSPIVFDADHRLDDEAVGTLLHAAQWAPSYGNLQPWAFLVLRRGSPGHRVLCRHLRRGNSGWVPRASVVFLAAARIAEEPDGPGIKEERYSYYDLGQAAAHLTLQARAMGLHAHQFGGFDRPAAAAELGLPPYLRMMSGIAVGVLGDPDTATEGDRERQRARVRERRGLGAFVHVDRWGAPWPGDGPPASDTRL